MEIDKFQELIDAIPILEKPYSRLWKDMQDKKRIHNQSKWGPDCDPEINICNTPMCTAGHLVNMAGSAAYKLKNATDWKYAASVIHRKAHPDLPAQNFGGIPQEFAEEYIKQMAEIEEAK
jgi:hypothetical protein